MLHGFRIHQTAQDSPISGSL